MRILFLSRAHLFDGSSSITNVPKAILGEMLRQNPDLLITWVISRNAHDDEVAADVLVPLSDVSDRLRMLKAGTDGYGRMMGYYLTEEIANQFRQTKTDMPYDLVLNQHPALAMQYKTILANRYRASRFNVQVPIVNWQMWTSTLDQMNAVSEYYVGPADIAAESMGAFFAERNVWESEHLMRSHQRTLKDWIAPHAVREVMQKSVHVPTGISYDEIEPARERHRARAAEGQGPVLFWGGRFANVKKPKVTFPLMRQVGLRHPTARVLVTTGHPKMPEWMDAEYPDWQIETSTNRARWFQRLGEGDVFLCNSISESYGLSWLEMLAAGMLGVFERQWWLDGLLPEWYPFIADSQAEQVEMASALMNDWPNGPLWTEFVPRVQEWLQAEHHSSDGARRMWAVLDEEHRKALADQERFARGSVGSLVVEAATKLWENDRQSIGMDDVFHSMNVASDTEREWGKHGDIISRMYLRQCLLAGGWRDVGDHSEVRFVPPEEEK